MNTDTVSNISENDSARYVHNARDVLMPQPQLTEVPFLQPLPSWTSVRWLADEYMYRCYAIPMPIHVADFLC